MRRIFRLMLRETSLIARDHSLLLTLLLAPVFYAFFYGSIYTNKEEEAVPMALVDEDHSALSQAMVVQLQQLQVLQTQTMPSLADAQEALYRGKVEGFVWIEKGLEQRVKSLQQANVVLATNAARFLPSSDITMAVNKLALAAGVGVRLQYEQAKGLTSREAMTDAMPVQLVYKPLFNERSSYGSFLLPGLLMLILQQTLLLGLAESTATEREHRLIPQWLATAGGSSSTALMGKGAFYFLLYMLYALFFLSINFAVLDLPNRANPWSLTLLLMLFVATLIPMGIFLGSLFRSALMAMQIMAFSTYPFFLTSGYSWPANALPVWLQAFSKALPTTPFLQAYTAMVQGGASLGQQLEALVHLALLALCYTSLALWRLRSLSRC